MLNTSEILENIEELVKKLQAATGDNAEEIIQAALKQAIKRYELPTVYLIDRQGKLHEYTKH